jgi:hypothetical protein
MMDTKMLGFLAQAFDEKVGADMTGYDAARSLVESLDADGYSVVPIVEVRQYLAEGGMGEVIGLTEMARQAGSPKVQMDTDMAMALCVLAGEAIKRRAAH